MWKHEIKKKSTHVSHVILLTCYTKTCLISQIRRDGVHPGTTSRRVVRQSEVGYIFSPAPWLARCYPSGQIPRIPHGFYKATRGI